MPVGRNIDQSFKTLGGFVQFLNAHFRLSDAAGCLHCSLVQGVHCLDCLLNSQRLLFGREGNLLSADSDVVYSF